MTYLSKTGIKENMIEIRQAKFNAETLFIKQILDSV